MNPKAIKLCFVALTGASLLMGCRPKQGIKAPATAAGDPRPEPQTPQDRAKPESDDSSLAQLEARPERPESSSSGAPEQRGGQEEIPFYFRRRILPEDLAGRSLREFALLRNTIYARAGNPFRKTWLDRHFRAQPWYQPQDKMNPDLLSKLDRENVEIIVNTEEALSKESLEQSLEKLLVKMQQTPEDAIELRLLFARLGKWAGAKASDRTPLEDPTLLDAVLDLRNLKEMSRRDLRILRNMIYARRGRAFSSEVVSSYFSRMDWYDPVENFNESMLRPVDRKNIRIVRSLEHSLGGPIRDADHPDADWAYIA